MTTDHNFWPNIPRLAFGVADEGRHNANLSWVLARREDLYGYLSGYADAARAVYATTVERSLSPDRMLFPLAFLWRHHIELCLKDIIAKGRVLQEKPWGFPGGHQLDDLWAEARSHIIECASEDTPELPIVEANIREFKKIDPSAAGFRYPLDVKGRSSSMPGAPAQVSLPQLQETMEALSGFLDAVRAAQSVRIDQHQSDLADRYQEQDQ